MQAAAPMKIRSIVTAASIAVLGLVLPDSAPAQTSLPTGTPESVGMSSARMERVSERMQHYVDAGQVAGVVSLVARKGSVVHLEARGFRDREAGVPMETDDIFVIMSMTKPIVSTALMMLFEEGKFLLGDPVSRWLPEFATMEVRVEDGQGGVRYERARPITMRHLLTHTAGLSSGRGAPSSPDGEEDRWTNPSADAQPRPGDSAVRAAVRRMATTPLNFQPGTSWQYGSATDAVAALVEIMSGQSVDDFLRERMFEPLGMHDTHYNLPPEKWERRARVYAGQRDQDWRVEPLPLEDPAETDFFGGVAGLYSTAPDYFRFAQMVLNGGVYDGVRLLSPKTINLMISNQIGDLVPAAGTGPGYRFGLGYYLISDVGLTRESYSPGTFGWFGIWNTYYFSDPVEDMVGILMIQLNPFGQINIRQDLGTLATQAIVEPLSESERKIRANKPLD